METRQKEQLPAEESEAQRPLLQTGVTTSLPCQCGSGNESVMTTRSHYNEEGRKLGACGGPLLRGTSDITPHPPVTGQT